MTEQREQSLLDGRIVLRPHDDGSFDELMMYEGKRCSVHAEMMSDGYLWIAFYPTDEYAKRVVMWINAKERKLSITAGTD